MNISKINKLLFLITALGSLSGCFVQQPTAQVEDKSGNYYGRSQKIAAVSHRDVATYSDDQILAKPLTPIAASNSNSSQAHEMRNDEHVLEVKKNRPSENVYIDKAKENALSKKNSDAYEANKAVNISNEDASDLTYESQEHGGPAQSDNKSEVKSVQSTNFKSKSPGSNSSFAWPIEGEVIARYGKNGNKFNEGINIAAPSGTIVNAASDGKVIYVGKKIEGYGNLMIIKHKSDVMTAYAHLQDILVEKGAEVKKGESIATVGQTGNVEKPQLHFSLRKGKKTIDPEGSIS